MTIGRRPCAVCGDPDRQRVRVLWRGLIDEWGLDEAEADYIDRQQGESCVRCGSNLRSMALAASICRAAGLDKTLLDALPDLARFKLLELNEAGTLSPLLRTLPYYTFAAYPEVDMRDMPYPAGAFDLVVHSDTLEHVSEPILALQECRRVLNLGGACCFTIPIVVGRMTRSRAGMPLSFHGAEEDARADFIVQSEYGADAWTQCAEAGFRTVSLDLFAYPAAMAIRASA